MDGKVHLALEQGTGSKREKPHVGLDIGVVFGLGNNRRLRQVTPYQHHVSVAVLAKVSRDKTYLEVITLLLNPRLGDRRLHLPGPGTSVWREQRSSELVSRLSSGDCLLPVP